MKKRLKKLAALGAAVMLLLCSCGREEAPAADTEPIPEEETAQEEEVQVQEPEEETIPLRVHITGNDKSYQREGEEEPYLSLHYCDVTIEGDGYENLKRNLEKWSMERSEELRGMYANEEYEAMDVTGTLSQTLQTARADAAVVSLLDDVYQYSGGAHGFSYRDGITFDAQSGKKLSLKDILTDYDTFASEASERIIYELKEEYAEGLFDDYEETVKAMWQAETEPAWYLDAAGIVIVFQEYSVGPYAIGMPEIHLSYTEFEPYIKSAYLPADSDSTAVFSANEEVFVKLPASGQKVSMMLSSEWEGDTLHSSLWFGSREMPLAEDVQIDHLYLLRTGNEIYCMMDADMASSDYETVIYRLTDGIIEKSAQIAGSIDAGNINSDLVGIETWVYLLGTYGGTKTYRFDTEGKFVTDDTEYVLQDNTYVLTTTRGLEVLLDETRSTLPAGSHIILCATDGESYAEFTIPETGQKGVLEVTRNAEGTFFELMDGMSEYDCFETLPYAG